MFTLSDETKAGAIVISLGLAMLLFFTWIVWSAGLDEKREQEEAIKCVTNGGQWIQATKSVFVCAPQSKGVTQ